jgi:hypothetical protein
MEIVKVRENLDARKADIRETGEVSAEIPATPSIAR